MAPRWLRELTQVQVDDFHRSVETLLRYLGDRRPKLWGALSALHISPSQASEHASLSATSIIELMDMPNAPPSALIPDQLVRFAQVVDTALFKSYLAIRPSLLGPLCRISNWCEVLEVEQVLRSRQVGDPRDRVKLLTRISNRNFPSSSFCIMANKCTTRHFLFFASKPFHRFLFLCLFPTG